MKNLLKMLAYLKSLDPHYIIWMSLTSLISAVTPLVVLTLSRILLNALVAGDTQNNIYILLAALLGTTFLLYNLQAYLKLQVDIRRRRIERRAAQGKSRKLMELDLAFLEDESFLTGLEEIEQKKYISNIGVTSLAEQVESVTGAFFNIILGIGLSFPIFLMPLSTGPISNPVLTVALFTGILLFAAFNTLLNNLNIKAAQEIVAGDLNRINLVFGYYVMRYGSTPEGAKDVRLYTSGFVQDVAKWLYKGSHEFIMTIFKQLGKYPSYQELLLGCNTFLIYAYIAFKAYVLKLPAGDILLFAGTITLVSEGLRNALVARTDLKLNWTYFSEYLEFMNLNEGKREGSLPVEKRLDRAYNLCAEKVSFSYPSTEKQVLKDINIDLQIAKKYAVVGLNGSGKTTMIKLLTRLYDPDQGRIKLNGIDVKKFDYNEYLELFSVVFQDFKLFSLSIAQNVACSTDYDAGKVKACLEKVGFGEMLETMPKGIETCLYTDYEEDGYQISGGEAQKIALARALYKNAPFMILDEPTAALDPVSEFEIYKHFQEIVEDRTTIYISHRLSSCRFCDEILVFDEGQIVQSGTHEELIQDPNGRYFELWNAQAAYYQENAGA
ncbi:MAG: ABC transporter ATP-binding protein [Eubacteriales bacterium]|nr:ABC transporter ATP-binding protein [Eubacteriales bacterium]